ncbi:MAG: sodium:glutamate symporter, partial [Proteobacteria bacterium]|nr:sodium:glutamate symporter [Pseudomonadota bacterium]
MTLSLNMFLTAALAVVVLYIGSWLKKRIRFLNTFCIPSPVVGGLLFSIISCILHAVGLLELTFDETLKTVCMVLFFTSVGFQANLKVLKSGGIALLLFLGCVCGLIVVQNLTSFGLSQVLGVSPLVGMSTGSIAMTGGHGTAGAFGPVLENMGLEGATTLCTAAATFGLVAGSLMGGPVGRRLIHKHSLKPKETEDEQEESVLAEDIAKHKRSVKGYAPAADQLFIAMGIGSILSELLTKAGLSIPLYIGPMLIAAAMRNIGE